MAKKLYNVYQEEISQIVVFLTWLEDVFPTRLEFTNKKALAEGFIAHRIRTSNGQR